MTDDELREQLDALAERGRKNERAIRLLREALRAIIDDDPGRLETIDEHLFMLVDPIDVGVVGHDPDEGGDDD